MSKKNIVSISILMIAVAIVIINVVHTNRASNKQEVNLETLEKLAEENISQTDNGQQIEVANTLTAAQDFTTETLYGAPASLADYKGKKVILNFWASWCPPCRAEMPHMQSYYEKHKSGDEVVIVAVNLTSADIESKVKDFVEEYKLSFPILMDKKGDISKLYRIGPIPTTFFLDEEGNIVQQVSGALDEETMTGIIDSY